MAQLKAIVPFEHGLSWICDEWMQRASHALVIDGRVWLVDPVDIPEAIEQARGLGEIAGVIQLLDRHNRDCAALAEHFGVPHHKLPTEIPDAPGLQVLPVLRGRMWKESALWWPDTGTLVVAELLGSNDTFVLNQRDAVGIHAFMRAHKARVGDHLPVSHLLMGHGLPQHEHAAEAIAAAYRRRWRDLPRLALVPLNVLRGGRGT